MKTMNNEERALKEALNELSSKDRVAFSYKWHNGLILAESLKKATGDDTFRFMPIPTVKSDVYLFKNSRRECVIVDKCGNIDVSDIDVHPTFIRKSQQRLSRTDNMLHSVGFA